MATYSRAEWNELIDTINTLATDCGVTATPLEHVDPNHIWAKSDIRAVQGRLQQICEDNVFTDPIPDLWLQSIIDEIMAAIAVGCCGDNCWLALWEVDAGFELIGDEFTAVVDCDDLPCEGSFCVQADNAEDAETIAGSQLEQQIKDFYEPLVGFAINSTNGTANLLTPLASIDCQDCP